MSSKLVLHEKDRDTYLLLKSLDRLMKNRKLQRPNAYQRFLRLSPLLILLMVSIFCVHALAATVAVIDTGADINHFMIKDQLWVNPNEIPDNHLDDDHNGYVDDVHGWNFVNNSNQLTDLHGHGTHIAGIIAKNSPSAKLMILKYFDPRLSPAKNLESTISAIKYATKMGAQIVNYSAGGPGANPQEEQAIKTSESKNILFVAAAGNDRKNTDETKYYPANYSLPNILSVMSVNSQNKISHFSNFGAHSVDIATTGEDIVSAAPGNQLVKMSGTSQATALITASASNLIDESLGASVQEIAARIKLSGYFLPSLKLKSKSEKLFDPRLLSSMRSSQESAFGERWANMIDIHPEQVLVPNP